MTSTAPGIKLSRTACSTCASSAAEPENVSCASAVTVTQVSKKTLMPVTSTSRTSSIFAEKMGRCVLSVQAHVHDFKHEPLRRQRAHRARAQPRPGLVGGVPDGRVEVEQE